MRPIAVVRQGDVDACWRIRIYDLDETKVGADAFTGHPYIDTNATIMLTASHALSPVEPDGIYLSGKSKANKARNELRRAINDALWETDEHDNRKRPTLVRALAMLASMGILFPDSFDELAEEDRLTA